VSTCHFNLLQADESRQIVLLPIKLLKTEVKNLFEVPLQLV